METVDAERARQLSLFRPLGTSHLPARPLTLGVAGPWRFHWFWLRLVRGQARRGIVVPPAGDPFLSARRPLRLIQHQATSAATTAATAKRTMQEVSLSCLLNCRSIVALLVGAPCEQTTADPSDHNPTDTSCRRILLHQLRLREA